MFQFTRPRGARPAEEGNERTNQGFNSRAHGGRDDPDRALVRLAQVSIHAPTGGATGLKDGEEAVLGFNSRAHGGRDVLGCGGVVFVNAFQFTRPRGARQDGLVAMWDGVEFQFTRPRGARQGGRVVLRDAGGFNSRAHGGRDGLLPRLQVQAPVSIHAPTGGATRLPPSSSAASGFQFTRPRGARLEILSATHPNESFNSRAHGGRDVTATL